MKVTQAMIETFFRGKAAGGMGTGTAGPGPGIQAVVKDLPEPEYVQALERFARAAVKSAETDGVDEWNDLVDTFRAMPDVVMRQLEKGA